MALTIVIKNNIFLKLYESISLIIGTLFEVHTSGPSYVSKLYAQSTPEIRQAPLIRVAKR